MRDHLTCTKGTIETDVCGIPWVIREGATALMEKATSLKFSGKILQMLNAVSLHKNVILSGGLWCDTDGAHLQPSVLSLDSDAQCELL